MSGGSAPANTTTTTTINQSPWQNATYRALALGTPGNLGPVAQQLKIGQQLTSDWMDIQSGRNPGLYYGLQNATPERLAQEAATREVGFPQGRAPATEPTAAPAEQPQAAAAGGIMNLRGYATGGQPKPKPKPKPKPEVLARPEADKNEYGFTTAQQTQWDKLENLRNSGKKMTQQQIKAYNDLKGIRTANPPAQNKPTGAPFSYSDLATPTAFLDPKTGQNMLADAQLAYQRARELGTPEQIGQATQAYNSAIQGLQGIANYQPERVTGASMSRGDIRDVAAQMAEVERYKAAEIERTRREAAAQTAGPKSWTDPGVARQYMNPYTQNVLDQELFEANRQAQMRENQQRSQATQQKAFGGTRAALQESEGRRNLGYLLSDIENKGLQQAYGQGMGQFQQEQQLGSQVGLANTQAINQLKSQYMSMGLTEAQANQAAINQASQFGAASQNQAYNNYVAQALQAQMANQQADLTTAQQNAQLAQQANLANQQAGLQANQQNIGAYGAMGNMAQGLGGLGATQSQIGLNNLAALGQSATAQTQFAQGALDRNTQNALNWYNLPSTFNAPGINALNAQPVGGGTTGSNTAYGQAKWFNKGGAVKWGPK